MFIRLKKTINKATKVTYTNYSIVENKTIDGHVVQKTILNLGQNFDLEPEFWKSLIARILTIINHQKLLFKPSNIVEDLAQYLAPKVRAALISPSNDTSKDTSKPTPVFIEETEIENPRTAGVARVALFAMERLGYKDIFIKVGLSSDEAMIAMAIIGSKLEHTGSDSSTYRWLTCTSALDEFLGINFGSRSVMAILRVLDILYKYKNEIENEIFSRRKSIFTPQNAIGLFDLTNTYFEGKPKSDKAQFGPSKEKRTDCLLESLAVLVDANGYINMSKFYPGNVAETKTFPEVVHEFKPAKNTIFMMDRGISSADNLINIIDNNCLYIVVSREKHREFDFNRSCTEIITKSNKKIKIYKDTIIWNYKNKDIKKEIDETRLFCYSPDRCIKEQSINNRKKRKLEAELNLLNEKLQKPKHSYDVSKIQKLLGALNNKYKISRHYKISIDISNDESNSSKPIRISYEFSPVQNTIMTHPGVYNLRTNIKNLSDAEIWDRFITLTDVERVFRSLKSDLGIRPIYHQVERRIDAHIFVCILAYQCVNYLLNTLRYKNIKYEWSRIAKELSTYYIATIKHKTETGIIKRRIFCNPTKKHLEIFKALDIPIVPELKSKLYRDGQASV
jgi:hypothetical protein